MIDELILEQLESFGLSDKEARAYIALLNIGTASARDISRKSKLNRSTSYVVLESLVKKGLANLLEDEGNRHYVASPPEHLVRTLEDKARQAADKLSIARSLLPELKYSRAIDGAKPRVIYYEGVEGIESVYEDTLTASETIRAFASIENMHAALPHYFPQYYARRAAKNIHIRSIHPDTQEAIERTMHDKEEARESSLVPKEKYNFSPEINIYDNKIAFMSLREKFGLIIESEELASAMKKVFELSWSEACRLNSTRHGPAILK